MQQMKIPISNGGSWESNEIYREREIKRGCMENLTLHVNRETLAFTGDRITRWITRINFRTDRYDTR